MMRLPGNCSNLSGHNWSLGDLLLPTNRFSQTLFRVLIFYGNKFLRLRVSGRGRCRTTSRMPFNTSPKNSRTRYFLHMNRVFDGVLVLYTRSARTGIALLRPAPRLSPRSPCALSCPLSFLLAPNPKDADGALPGALGTASFTLHQVLCQPFVHATI